jgi:hypothetical protein
MLSRTQQCCVYAGAAWGDDEEEDGMQPFPSGVARTPRSGPRLAPPPSRPAWGDGRDEWDARGFRGDDGGRRDGSARVGPEGTERGRRPSYTRSPVLGPSGDARRMSVDSSDHQPSDPRRRSVDGPGGRKLVPRGFGGMEVCTLRYSSVEVLALRCTRSPISASLTSDVL